MKQTKSNFGPLCDPVAYTLDIAGGQAHITPIAFNDERLDGVEAAIPAQKRIALAFQAGNFNGGATTTDIADHLGLGQKTVRNKLGQMRKRGLVVLDGRIWRQAPSPGWSQYDLK
jgi:hypothetical protein